MFLPKSSAREQLCLPRNNFIVLRHHMLKHNKVGNCQQLICTQNLRNVQPVEKIKAESNCPGTCQKLSNFNGLVKRSSASPVIRYPAFNSFLILVFDAEKRLQEGKRALIERDTIPEHLDLRIGRDTSAQKHFAITAQNPGKVVGGITQSRSAKIKNATDHLPRQVNKDVRGAEVAMLEHGFGEKVCWVP